VYLCIFRKLCTPFLSLSNNHHRALHSPRSTMPGSNSALNVHSVQNIMEAQDSLQRMSENVRTYSMSFAPAQQVSLRGRTHSHPILAG
jgi:hypothetical protein